MSHQEQTCTWNNLQVIGAGHTEWLARGKYFSSFDFQNVRKVELGVPYDNCFYWNEAYNRQVWENKQRQIQVQNRLESQHFASQQQEIQSKAGFDPTNFVQNFKNYVPTSQRTITGYERMQASQSLGWENAQDGNCLQQNLRNVSTQFNPNYQSINSRQSCFQCCTQHSCWNLIPHSDISAFPPVYQRLSNPAPIVRNPTARSLSELTNPLTVDTSLEYEVSHSLNVSTVSEPLLAVAHTHQDWSTLQTSKSGSKESIRPTVSEYNSPQKEESHEARGTFKLSQNLLLQNSISKLRRSEVVETTQPSVKEVVDKKNVFIISGHGYTKDSEKSVETTQEQQQLLMFQLKTSQINRKRKMIEVEQTEVSAKKCHAFPLNKLPTSFTPPDLLSSSYKFFEAGSQDWITSGEWIKAGTDVWNWPSTSRPSNLFVY